jgi:MFS family permease
VPSFRRLWTASTASNLGDGVLVAAVPLLAREATSDPLGIALVTAAATAPWLLFGLAAGVVVDRRDRLQTMVTADVARAAVLAVVTIAAATDRLSLSVLVVAVFALGVGETLFDTAAQAVLPRLVEADQLEAANGRLFAGQLAANGFLGPPLGGALVAAAVAAPLAVDAVTFAVSALLLRGLLPREVRPARPEGARLSTELREGLAWLWSHATVRGLAIGAAAVNLAHTAVLAVLVVLVRDELGASATAYGVVLGGSAVGGVLGTFASAPVTAALGRRSALLAALGAFTLGLAITGAATHPAVVAVGLALFGIGSEVWNVVAVSYRQARVPEHLLGRVMATYRFIAYGAMPVGAAAGGALATTLGVRAPFAAAAATTLVLAVYLARVTRDDPALRRSASTARRR